MNRNLLKRKALRIAMLILLLNAIGITNGNAYDFSAVCSTGQTLYYNITDATNHYVMVVSPRGNGWENYTKPTGSVVISENVTNNEDSYIVVGIGSFAFYGCDQLTGNFSIPSTVTSIGDKAFYNCTGINSITTGGSVEIGSRAFYNCSGLTSVAISNSVTTIGTSAFHGCSGLMSISIPNSLTIIEEGTFAGCSGLSSVTIPNTVTNIGESAFEGCSGLTTMVIGNSVTEIGRYAFGGCSGLSSINIPSSVVSIGMEAFRDCSGLTSITIPNSVTRINAATFHGCSGLISVSIPNTVTYIGGDAFTNCSALISVTIPNSVKTIGQNAFYNCIGLTSVLLPDSLTSIEKGTFLGCRGLESLNIPESVLNIGEYAFRNSGLTSITIPSSVSSIGNFAFYNCSGLTTVFWNAEDVTNYPTTANNPFKYCANIETVVFGDEVRTIPDGTFYGCSGLASLTISSPITKIKNHAFNNWMGLKTVYWNAVDAKIIRYVTGNPSPFVDCVNLEAVVFGNEVQTIPDCVFENCSSLNSVTIGNSVDTIGNRAFRGCNGLLSLSISNSVTSIGDDAFYGCSGLLTLTIPNSVVSIGDDAFSNCSGLTTMSIGNSVETIGQRAFYNCSGLTTLTIPGSVTGIGDNAFRGCNGLSTVNWDAIRVTSYPTYESVFDNSLGTVVFGNLVQTIPNFAFYGCSGLTALSIGNSVETIGQRAFYNCSGLTTLTIPGFVTGIGDNAFRGCNGLTKVNWNAENITDYPDYNSHPFMNCTHLKTVVFGNQVQTIPAYAFYDCDSLTGTLTIPNSVISIGNYAFRGCSGFTGSLTIGNSVTTIGNYAFYGCSGFTGSLTIGNSVATIGSSAFSGCSGFSGINWNAINAGFSSSYSSPFYGWTNLSTVVFGNQVQTIPANIFKGCSGLTGSLTIPSSVTTIGNSAFDGCSGLTGSLTIPNSVTTIGNYAFYGCSGFTGSLTIGNSVATIGSSAFSGCSGFSGINWNAINAGFSSSYSSPFYGWTNLSTVVFGDQVQTIPPYIFSGCNGLTGSLTIPNSVTTIGSSAFRDCSGFTGSLTIGNSVTLIDDYAFYNCSGFTGSLTIGNSVTTIGSSAFYGCSNLNSVYYTGDIAQWCNISFGGYSGSSNPLSYAHNLYIDNELVTNLVIPETVTEIKNYTFYGCSGLTGSLSIPSSVTTIGNSAFYECSGFTGTLSISNSVESIGSYAFSYCSGLNSVRIQCSTPPTIAQSSFNFNGADKTIPIFVPCGTQDDYKTAQYWSEFENINESPYNLVITSNDKLGGEISVLEYADCEDNHCAILAVPNIGYNFLGWYVDDYFATITPFCDFSLTEDVTFEARFEMLPNHNVANGTSNLWSDPGTWFLGEVPDATSTVGIRKNVIVDVDADVSAVGIYGNSTLTVLSGVTLTVTDTLGSTKNSSIIIQDGGQLVHSSDSAAATIQKSIEPYTSDDDGWNLISFPLVGNGDLTTVDNMLSNQYDLYAYDEPSSVWKNQKNESNDFTTLEAGVGYLYANRGVGVGDVEGSKIGEGTSTIGNSPFQTYWKYSIAENLFLASELEGAGLTTAPLGALCWYATNTTGYQQSNISIWMANVSDAELTETSHDVRGMTLVFTGSMTPLVGWNTFAFNENSFAWDGTSNVLVCVQRNNGVYNSTIYWQAHDPGFAATSYKYNDGSAYDMTTETYSVTVSSSLRPNTIFQTIGQVGQYESYLPITMSFAGGIENGAAEVTVPLSYTEGISLAGFNLVGNPFVHNVTSYVGTNVADGCYRMNETRDNLIVSEISTSNPLKPAEGFFVKATGEGASVTFNQQTRGLAEKSGYINLELSSNGKLIDRLMVRDRVEPLEKLSLGHSKARLFVVKDHQEMAIVPMEGNEQPIYFKTAKNGTYTITVNLEGMELNYLHLIDHKTGANVNLLAEPSYSFEARNSDYESRFQLVYSLEGGNGSDDEPFAFISNGQIIVDGTGTLQIFDVTGRMISSQKASNNIPIIGMSAGVYMLHLVNNDNVKIQKIVIK